MELFSLFSCAGNRDQLKSQQNIFRNLLEFHLKYSQWFAFISQKITYFYNQEQKFHLQKYEFSTKYQLSLQLIQSWNENANCNEGMKKESDSAS